MLMFVCYIRADKHTGLIHPLNICSYEFAFGNFFKETTSQNLDMWKFSLTTAVHIESTCREIQSLTELPCLVRLLSYELFGGGV